MLHRFPEPVDSCEILTAAGSYETCHILQILDVASENAFERWVHYSQGCHHTAHDPRSSLSANRSHAPFSIEYDDGMSEFLREIFRPVEGLQRKQWTTPEPCGIDGMR